MRRHLLVALTLALVFDAVLLASTLSGPECAKSWGPNQSNQVAYERDAALGKIYFSYTRRFGDGSFASLEAAIPHLAELGIKRLWISPVHPQTTGQKNETFNDHYYWWSNPSEVALELGGVEGLKRLISKAQSYGIEVCLDTVLDHSGYTDSVMMSYRRDNGTEVRKTLNVKDQGYFRHNYHEGRLNEIYGLMDTASTPEAAFFYQNELARMQWDRELPVFNHDNEEIYEWLFLSYRSFIDLGIYSFRLDAFKHMPMTFLLRFINDMSAYAQMKYQKRLVFLAEHLVTNANYVPIDAFAKFFRDHARNADVYFIDFPKAYESRRLANDPKYGLNHFADFIRYREDQGNEFLLDRLVGDAENHDFLEPVDSSKFNRQLVFAVSDYFSSEPTILFHGGESLDRGGAARIGIPGIDAQGIIGVMTKRINDALDPVRASHEFRKTHFHSTDFDTMLAEKKVGSSTYILFVRRGPGGHIYDMHSELAKKFPGQPLKLDFIYDSSNGERLKVSQSNPGQLRLSTYGETVALLRLSFP
jgi:hypothetical protein